MTLADVVYTSLGIFLSVGVIFFLLGFIISRSKKSKQSICKVLD